MSLSQQETREFGGVQFDSRGYLKSSCNSGLEKSLFFLSELSIHWVKKMFRSLAQLPNVWKKHYEQQSAQDAVTVIKLLSDVKVLVL